ncbi:unnamed protein product [Ceutorhynchus assimilis]|uniref:Uncharacterized protein n=1 Tax=Ceutorhynchus assimilis TaxID=467358 RepID=A0A9N9MMG9_9CUCU|nr:unnamed protein product [Ceutorhynchus assimilis]
MEPLHIEEILQGPSDSSTVESEFLSTINITESTHLNTSGRDAKFSARRPNKAHPGGLKSRTLPRLMPVSSQIPLPLKQEPIKINSFIKNVRSSPSRPVTLNASLENKHTLEIQFINKNKRFLLLKRELEEKQKPVMELHKTLMQLKKRLEELGKFVTLEDLKLASVKEYQKNLMRSEGDGENLPNIRSSLDQIVNTMMDVCTNLVNRRALIVEVLEKVANSELDHSDVLSKIETLKNEGQTLENSLKTIIKEQQAKINELIAEWESLLISKQSNVESEQLKLPPQELVQESKDKISHLQKKIEENKGIYDKSIAELNGNVRTLREQIQKLERDLECERKATKDNKIRNLTNTRNSKAMKDKITELENNKISSNAAKVDLERKIRILQDQLMNKEAQWNKEKEEMNKVIIKHEGVVRKITSERAEYETTLESIENQKMTTEEELQNKIEYLENQMESLCNENGENAKKREEAETKCAEFESFISDMRLENKKTMNKVCDSMKMGKNIANEQAELLRENMAKDLEIRELRDNVTYLERERLILFDEKRKLEEEAKYIPTVTEKEISKQQKYIYKYKSLLEESEKKLLQKCNEVSYLQTEIQHLKVRQESLEEQNLKCPADKLQEIVDKGRYKLNTLMKKTIENEQKLEQYIKLLEQKDLQIGNMETLLHQREETTVILKAVQEDVVSEKQSLTKYASELRKNLSQVVKESKMKDRAIKELQDKIELRERQMAKMEKEIEELATNVLIGNDKRFKLQEMVEAMEQELRRTKLHVNQLADINFRKGRKKYKPF